MINFFITPADFLRSVGAEFKTGSKWLRFTRCPFCDGGGSGDVMTFIVHAADGNFSCSRSKCGESGSFWKLIEFYGRNPRDYSDSSSPAQKTQRKKKKGFIYGR